MSVRRAPSSIGLVRWALTPVATKRPIRAREAVQPRHVHVEPVAVLPGRLDGVPAVGRGAGR